MLRFLLVSMYELKQFLQIVLWIAIPGTVIAFLVTTLFHYKRKKRIADGTEPEPAYMEGGGFHTVVATEPNANNQVPDWLASGANPDNQPLIKKYEQEVRRYRENYATLEQDFRELEGKYSDLLNKAYSTEKQNDDSTSRLQLEINGYKLKVTQLQQALDTAHVNAKLVQSDQIPEALSQSQQQVQQLQDTIQQLQEKLRTQQDLKEKNAAEVTRLENLMKNMEYSAKSAQSESEELQRYYAKQVDELGVQYKSEKSDLSVQLQQLQKTVQQLKDENAALLQKVQANGEPKYGGYEQQIKELQLLLSKAEDEKASLKNKITDQQYLQDVLQEKKLQIEFLQNQLEQRIRTFREVEKEAADKTQQVQQTQSQKDNFEREIHAMREELQQQREEVTAWQLAVERSREEIRQYQDSVRSKTGHIENLERNLHEVQQQQAVLQLVLDDKQNMITSLQESLNREQHKTKDLEGKLVTNNQLLSKIYGDLSKTLSNPPASQQQNGTKLNGNNGTNGTNGTNGSNGHTVNGNGFNFANQNH